MGTTEKNLAKLNTSTEYNTWLVKRDSLIFVKKELPLSQYDTMKTFYSLQEKTPSPFIVKIYNVFATETLCIIEEEWLSGNASPQSTTIILSSVSKAVIFIPICSKPPKGTIRTLSFPVLTFLLKITPLCSLYDNSTSSNNSSKYFDIMRSSSSSSTISYSTLSFSSSTARKINEISSSSAS